MTGAAPDDEQVPASAWAVVDEPEPSVEPAWRSAPPTVAAVLVTHNGGRWLPQVLASYAALEHAPTRWRVVDVSSTDDGADLVRQSFGADRIEYAPAGTGFGEAVSRAVDAMPRTDWIWLLHDDAVLDPGVLAGLLDEATAAPDVAAVGPKIREWPSLRRLLEVGLTVTTTGSRETGLETGEPDAGQHDWPRDVLAVNTAGMLVRRDVWDELGGLDPELPLYFDDVDFGWRAARAGYRVRYAPGAVLFHAEASRRGTRRRVAGDVEPWERRRAALHTMLANAAPGPRFWWQYVRLLFGTLLRALGFLIGQDPESAGDELQALAAVYGRPGRLRAARRRRAETAVCGHDAVADLLAPPWLPYRHGYDAVRDTVVALVRPETVETVGRRSAAGDGPGTEPAQLDDGPALWRRRPWLTVALVMTLGALVAARDLLTGPAGSTLLGGALPPTPPTAGGWWRLWFEPFHDIGLGSTSLPPTAVLLLAAAATPVWFAPGLLVAVLLLLGPVLAALAAHRLGRRLSDARGPRIVWAASYGAAVVATGAVDEGRIGTVVALVVLPIVVSAALQLVDVVAARRRARHAVRQSAVRLALWLAVGIAFAPILAPVAFLGLGAAVLADRRLLRPVAGAGLGALVLVGPWLLGRLAPPTRLWWEAGEPLPGADAGAATALSLLAGRAGSPVEAPWWLGLGVVVLALAALVPRPTRFVVTLCWVVAVTSLALATLGTRTSYTVSGSTEVAAWVAVPAVAWIFALLTAVLLAWPVVPGGIAGARVLGALAVVVALVLPLGVGTWWVLTGSDDPLRRDTPSTVPAFLTERDGSTLVLRTAADRSLEIDVVRGAGPVLGEEGLRPDPARQRAVADAVEGIIGSPSQEDVRTLGANGIGAVYAPDVSPALERRLDAAPLLEPAGSESPTSRVWTLTEAPADVDDGGPWWRPVLAALQVVAWLLAVLLQAPVRRRRTDEEDPAPVTGSVEGGARR